MSINKLIHKQNVVYLFYSKLLRNKKQQPFDTHNDMDGSQSNHTE